MATKARATVTGRRTSLPAGRQPTEWPAVLPDYDGVVVRRVTSRDDPEWVGFLARARDASGLSQADLRILRAASPTTGAGTDVAFLLRRQSSEHAEAGGAVLRAARVAERVHAVTVACAALADDGPDLAGLAADCASDQVRADLMWWRRLLGADDVLAVRVGPGPDGRRGGTMAMAVAESLETFPTEPDGPPRALGYGLDVDAVGADGKPCRLPQPSWVSPSEDALPGWRRLVRACDGVLLRSASQVVLRLKGGGLDASDGEGGLVGTPEQWEEMAPGSDTALSEILSEAGLGEDAALVVTWDYHAVVSAASLEDRDWSQGFGLALIDLEGRDRAARRRDVRRLWTAMPDELRSVLDARRGSAAPVRHPGNVLRH